MPKANRASRRPLHAKGKQGVLFLLRVSKVRHRTRRSHKLPLVPQSPRFAIVPQGHTRLPLYPKVTQASHCTPRSSSPLDPKPDKASSQRPQRDGKRPDWIISRGLTRRVLVAGPGGMKVPVFHTPSTHPRHVEDRHYIHAQHA
jgi:hypothetical protein